MKILILALAACAFVASPLALSLANEVMLAALGALALTILMGAAGLLTLGHAALLGAGAFTVGVLTQELGVPAVVTLPASVLVGAGLGLVAGLPSLRLRGIYLALSTLALHFAVLYVASEYQTRRQISTGIVVPDPVFGPISVGDQRAWFVLLGCVLLATGLLCRALLRSRTGRAWLALRERDVAASSVGVHVTGYKLAAFVISSWETRTWPNGAHESGYPRRNPLAGGRQTNGPSRRGAARLYARSGRAEHLTQLGLWRGRQPVCTRRRTIGPHMGIPVRRAGLDERPIPI
jgi:ABC-type branched-subunit amino acid transport system permease subunit